MLSTLALSFVLASQPKAASANDAALTKSVVQKATALGWKRTTNLRTPAHKSALLHEEFSKGSFRLRVDVNRKGSQAEAVKALGALRRKGAILSEIEEPALEPYALRTAVPDFADIRIADMKLYAVSEGLWVDGALGRDVVRVQLGRTNSAASDISATKAHRLYQDVVTVAQLLGTTLMGRVKTAK